MLMAGVGAAAVREPFGPRGPAAGVRAAWLAADDPACDGAPRPLHWRWARVAPRHQPCGRAAGEAVAPWPALGAGRDRGPASDRRPGRRRTGGRVEHRQRRRPCRGQAGPDRRPTPVRGRAGHRRRRARVASHPARRQVRHRDHRPHADSRRHRSSTAARHGRRPLQTSLQAVARDAPGVVAGRGGDRRDGRLHRVQDRHRRGTARRRRGDGSLPRRASGR
jgi:hypothetical protein